MAKMMSKKVAHQGELEKSTVLGKDLVLINGFSDSDLHLLRSWMTKASMKTCRDFDMVKRSKLSSPISRTSSTRKVLKKIAKRFAAMAVFMGRDTEEILWRWILYASHSINQLASISAVLAVGKGKLNLEMLLLHHLEGFRFNLRPELYLDRKSARLRHANDEEPMSEEAEYPAFRLVSEVAKDGIEGLKDGNPSPNHDHKDKAILLNSISVIRRELSEPSLGWPLLRRKSSPNQEFMKHEARDISVVEWVMSLPDRVTPVANEIALHSNRTTEEAIHSSEEEAVINDNRTSKNENLGLEYNQEVSVSLNTKDLEFNSKPGWPLLSITASITSDSFSEYEAIKMPMVEREMNAPIELTPSKTALLSTEEENPVQVENHLPALRKIPSDLELPCKKFSLRELKQATSEFSPENLIGEGGCSNVYKGCLPDGKPVAVKILKSYKEAWSDFSLEVDIVSSLKHKHIMPLIGVCVENDHLILVHDFFARGSLEEILHDQSKKFVLPWGIRFKMAMAIADALDYLHNECSPPIIHRDVKSSNILLSHDFQPQLSDFGLAIRGPTDSTYMIESNVVGTFGYMAPEYFMEGRVSNKIDVYSFGVVLLELLSGRRPISSNTLRGQEILIQWAKALLESRNLQGLVDPALNGKFDTTQMQRMVLAASLCLNRLDGYRPRVSQILQILRGEKEQIQSYNMSATDMKEPNDQDGGGFHKLYTNLSIPFTDDDGDSTSKSRNYRLSRLMLKDYLKMVQD